MFYTLPCMDEMTNAEIVSRVMDNPQDIFIGNFNLNGKKAIAITGMFSKRFEAITQKMCQITSVKTAVCHVGEALECIITPNSEEISVEDEVMRALSVM